MSVESKETIADIVADIREQNLGLPEDGYALSPLAGDLLSFADRIEAALKREREAGAEAAHIVGEIRELIGREATIEKSSAVGNAAAMREALEKVLRVLHCAIVADILKGDDVNSAFNEVTAALSAPPRNCDVGTAEEQEKRFNSFCKTHLSGTRSICSAQCPCVGCRSMFHCLTKWSQMPYDEGGAK